MTLTTPSLAGMPSFGFDQVTAIRIEDLSFFLVVLLLSALAVKWLWNVTAKDFPKLPRLGYRRALAMTALLGLFTVLVLSMVSGARELLTPGAWRKQGATYRLIDPATESLRKKSITTLRSALWLYAKTHDGKFPQDDFDPELMHDIWESASERGHRYIYNGGLALDGPRKVLALEPDVFGDERYILFSDGEVKKVARVEIERATQRPESTPTSAQLP
jgi:hypothetical protein